MMRFKLSILALPIALAGCLAGPSLGFDPEPTSFRYSPPEESKLKGLRPYPSAGDVCLVMAANATTRGLMRPDAVLIGCPKHEFGAIRDRLSEGANIVAHAKHWSLLSVPK